MRQLQVLLMISSLYFVHCGSPEEIKQFSWDLFKKLALALSKDNVIMNGFGPQLLLLEIQLGAKGKTKEEIITIAKSSSHQTLITFNDYLKRPESELNDFNTQIASYVASTTKLHDTFINEMFERTVEFRTTNFNDISVTNSLFKRFYNYIHYNIEDNYPESTKMVLKSSSTLDFQIDCHKLYSKKFYVQKNTLPQVFDTSKIYGSFNGGTIKNEKKNVIADWAELPKQYMKGNDISIVFVKPVKTLTVDIVLKQIKDLNFREVATTYPFLEFPLLLMTDVVSLNDYLKEMGISSMFSDKYANFTGITGPKDENEIFVNDIKQTAEINIGCKIVDPPASTSENGGFELDSPFIYIVFHAKTQIPLLIGKLSDPGNAKPDYRRSTCKIPKVENGYIQDVNYNDVYPERHEVPVDETKVQVKCNPSYDLRISDSKLESTCDTSGWSGSFPNCTKMCQINTLVSHSTRAICRKGSTKYDCPLSVLPGYKVSIECKQMYKDDKSIQKDFKCQNTGEFDGSKWNECTAECGQILPETSSGRYKVHPNDIPWNVAIYKGNEQICGGTIISELIVLSAAHCFKAEQIKGVSDIVKSKYKVIAGKYFRDYDAKEDLPTQTLKVTDITIPERYTGMKGYYYGDIAVLTLDKIIIYQNHISPVCLNFSAKDNNKSLPAEDTNGFVAGFGVTEEGVSSATLKILSLPYIPYTKCIAFVPDEYTSYIQSDKFCAGSNNTGGVCKGDSGGGISFKHNDTYFIYGILSNALFFNETSCNLHMYSLFTKVMDHIGMIYDKYLNSTKILRNLLENPKNTETEYI